MGDYREQIIAEHYGVVPQLHKAMEELIELHDAIKEYLETGSTKAYHHVVEEIGDTEIMLSQTKWNLDIHPDAVTDVKTYKLGRVMRDIEQIEDIPEATYGN